MNRRDSFLAGLILTGFCAALALANDDFPRADLTPGVVASTDIHDVCGTVGGLTYSKRHRATTSEMKHEVLRRYGVSHAGEIDHRVPLCLGGADDIRNLWPQQSFAAKDKLEAATCRAVCSGQLSLQAGQTLFLGDWRR